MLRYLDDAKRVRLPPFSANTGHLGSFGTIDANTTGQALSRLANLVLMSLVEMPLRGIKDAIALAIDLLVHIETAWTASAG